MPNASALLLNSSASAFDLAQDIRKQSGIDTTLHREVNFQSDKDAFDYIEKMIESIILAFTAIEAFANEAIPIDYVHARHLKSSIVLEGSSKETIERHLSLDEKLANVLPQIFGCTSPKGGRSWSGYVALKGVRDRIIHMKTEDRRSSGPEVNTVWKAIIITSAPHIAAKSIIDYFVYQIKERPLWHQNFPYSAP